MLRRMVPEYSPSTTSSASSPSADNSSLLLSLSPILRNCFLNYRLFAHFVVLMTLWEMTFSSAIAQGVAERIISNA